MKIHKDMTNGEIAELLTAAAASYKLKDEKKNRFKIIAYENAATGVEHASSEVKDIWDEGKLEEVPGIGKSIANHLAAIFKTGKSSHFEKLFAGIPPATFELMKVPGIGAKTAFKFAKTLGITKEQNAIKKLEEALQKGKVARIEGFGEISEEALKKSIKEVTGRQKRLLLNYATAISEEVIRYLAKDKNTLNVDALGSLRRKASTVGDIDIAVATNEPKKVINHFTRYSKAKRVLEKGDRTASIVLPGDVQVDLLVQEPESYGASLQHFTGSKHHNIALREYALKKKLSLSEYGIKQIKKSNPLHSKKAKIKNFKTEGEFYEFLGMEWIPPELREEAGEIEAAINHKLPGLVELADIKADLQIHSDFNIETSHDVGESSMEEIVGKANELGYEYIAFTEHNPSQRGHDEKDFINILKRKQVQIEQLNKSLVKRVKGSVKKVFNSLEIDILPQGKLPVSDKAMELLDFALVSIHSSFTQDKKEATKRVLRALNHPKVKIFAHPTGRKLNQREGIELDWEKIFDLCLKEDKWLEINADPMRLDLPDFLVREAIKAGVKLTLGTDTHFVEQMNNMIYGVYVARRGWAEKKNIINTLGYQEFESMLK